MLLDIVGVPVTFGRPTFIQLWGSYSAHNLAIFLESMDYEPLLNSDYEEDRFISSKSRRSSSSVCVESTSIELKTNDSQSKTTDSAIIEDYWPHPLSMKSWSDDDQRILQSLKDINRKSRYFCIVKKRIASFNPIYLNELKSIDLSYRDGSRGYTSVRSCVKFVDFFLKPCFDVLTLSSIDTNGEKAERDEDGNITVSAALHQLPSTLSGISFSTGDPGFLWIRLQDIMNLPEVATRFIAEDYEECTEFFSDRRAHSNFLEVSEGFFLSFCSFHLPSSCDSVPDSDVFLDEDGDECFMRKLFIYATAQVIITFEVDVVSIDCIDHVGNEGKDGLNKAGLKDQSRGLPRYKSSTRRSKIEKSLLLFDQRDVYLRYQQKGMSYLISDLITKSLALQDPLLVFCYKGISYYQQQIKDNKITDRLGRGADGDPLSAEETGIRIREIESCLVLMKDHIEEGLSVINHLCNLVQKNTCVDRFLSGSVGSSCLRPFHSARDNYQFAISCLKQDVIESFHLQADLKAVIKLRERRTAVRIWIEV